MLEQYRTKRASSRGARDSFRESLAAWLLPGVRRVRGRIEAGEEGIAQPEQEYPNEGQKDDLNVPTQGSIILRSVVCVIAVTWRHDQTPVYSISWQRCI
jgi:hypothetical protein